LKGAFVTGTDTGVGKTIASAMLAKARGWGYWKPVQTGPDSDTATVARLVACRIWDRGVRLNEPFSPHLAARLAGTHIDVAQIVAMAPPDGPWIVEGAGGVLVPLNGRETMADLMLALALPVIVIARSTLGTINHTLLTLEALRTRGLTVERVIMVGDNPENRAAIAERSGLPVDVQPWIEL
jgi:dethiobiotin synthase